MSASWNPPSNHAIEAPQEQRYRLTPIWYRVTLSGWLATTLGLVAVGTSSHVIGRPVFWLDDQRWTIPGAVLIAIAVAIPIFATILTCYLHGPGVPYLSSLATFELALLALLDRNRSPGSAVVLTALTVAALLFSMASFAGMYRQTKTPAS